jgi:hypothetical protein
LSYHYLQLIPDICRTELVLGTSSQALSCMHYSFTLKWPDTCSIRRESQMTDIVYWLLYLSVFSTFHSNIVIHENDVFWVNSRLANVCMKIYLSCFLMMLCFCSITTDCKFSVITDLCILQRAATKHEGKAFCSRAACCSREESKASTTADGMVSVWPEIAPLCASTPKILMGNKLLYMLTWFLLPWYYDSSLLECYSVYQG